jgi:hypothetical protein
MKYYEIIIEQTSKPRGKSKVDYYQRFHEETKVFNTLPEVREYLKETYGKCKTSMIFRDKKDGTTEPIGTVYHFNNSDISHSPEEKWHQQDWVEVREIKATSVIVKT